MKWLCKLAAATALLVALMPAGQRAWAADSYELSGTVSSTDGPVSDVAIELTSTDPAATSVTTTDAFGRYSVVLPAGAYQAVFVPPATSGLASTTVDRVDISGPLVLDLVLVPTGTARIRGVVRDQSGVPASGVLVQVCCQASGGEASAVTDASGAYSVEVAPGTYYLVLQNGERTHPGLPALFTLISQNITLSGDTVRDLALPATATLTVRVVDSAGAPVAGATVRPGEFPLAVPHSVGAGVTLRDPSRSSDGQRTTDADGQATFTFMAPSTATGLTAKPPPGSDLQEVSTLMGPFAGDAIHVLRFVNPLVDLTPPHVSIIGVTDGADYTVGAVPTPGCVTDDGGSGVEVPAELSVTGGNADGTGSFTVTCSGARDKAGNTAPAISASYRVHYEVPTGGFAPGAVDNPPIVNVGRAGRTYQLAFALTRADGSFVTDPNVISAITYSPVPCSDFADQLADTVEAETTGSSGLRYDTGSNQFRYNWKTPSQQGCYAFEVRLIDDTHITAWFRLS